MQRLGLILHITPSRNMIAKAENQAKIGDTVIDENLKPVGNIFDIFGPTSSPYIAIRPTTQDPHRLVNKQVYVVPSKRRKEKHRYGFRR